MNACCCNEMRTNRVRKKVAYCDAKLPCGKPAPTANHLCSKRTCDFWCTWTPIARNNVPSLLCGAFCESTKASASGRFPLLFQWCHGKCGGGCTRESRPQKLRSQVQCPKCDAPRPNGTCPQGIGEIAPFLRPIAPIDSRLRQNLSTRKHRFSFLAHTTSVSPLLC